MVARTVGRRIPLSLPRVWIGDFLAAARRVPTVPVQRRMRLGDLAEARRLRLPRPSWTALFTKGFALAARALPELRRSYLGGPGACLYEHARSVGSVAIERPYLGESAVFFARLEEPADQSVAAIDRHLAHCRAAEPASVGPFRRLIRYSRLPRPVRRLLWWAGLNVSGGLRERMFGTFGVSAYSALGAESLHPLSPLSMTLTYGAIDADGGVDVRLVYDHRVTDGAAVARALSRIEAELNGAVTRELLSWDTEGADDGHPREPVVPRQVREGVLGSEARPAVSGAVAGHD